MKSIAVICMRTSQSKVVITRSVVRRCALCEETVYITRTGLDLVEQHHGAIHCVECALASDDRGEILPPTEAQQEECRQFGFPPIPKFDWDDLEKHAR